MPKSRFEDQNCAIAQALDVLGDGWTLLVLREAFLGLRRFSDFERRLGIAKNILSERLRHLVEHGVLVRDDVGQRGERYEYRLSEKGRDLITVVTALRQWGDRWIYGEGREPVVVRDRRSLRPIGVLHITDADGCPLEPWEMVVEPGSGADEETRRRWQKQRQG